MNFAIVMLTASCLAGTEPVSVAPKLGSITFESSCGCGSPAPSACGCESAAKPGFFDRLRGVFSSSKKSSNCDCAAGVSKSVGCSTCGDSAKPYASPAPVVIHLPSDAPCGCGQASEQPTFFEKLTARFHHSTSSSSCGCSSAAPVASGCSTCGIVSSANAPAAPIKPAPTVLPATNPGSTAPTKAGN